MTWHDVGIFAGFITVLVGIPSVLIILGIVVCRRLRLWP